MRNGQSVETQSIARESKRSQWAATVMASAMWWRLATTRRGALILRPSVMVTADEAGRTTMLPR